MAVTSRYQRVRRIGRNQRAAGIGNRFVAVNDLTMRTLALC